MIKKTTILIAFVALIFSINPINSQSFNDFSNVNFSELSDGEIDLLLRRATAQGYTQFDLLKMARSQGFTQADIENLDKRFKSAQTIARIAESATTPLEETRLRKQWLQNLEVFRETDSDVFGYNVFRGTSFLSFQSNLNLPTPDDYIVGAGDKLFIDIYGQSEAYYQAEISPEGYAILENIGPVNVNGLTIKDARTRLIQRFKRVYNGIDQNKTFINVSVGIPRAIRINITGEVQLPGTYNFSAFNTMYNALYVAGGITENATLRDIKLYRNNRLVSSVDVYKFLTSGDGSSNIRLENNDLIVVSPYKERVVVEGAVKIPGRFEMKEGESLSDLIFFAGGFKENAYRKSVKVTRIFDNKLKVVDVNSDQFDFFTPKAGDKFEIDSVVQKYQDRIILKGSVYRPGIYSLSSVKNIKDLIIKAEGIKPDTYLNKAYITRTNDDLTTTNIQFNVYDQLNNIDKELLLEEEDVVTILGEIFGIDNLMGVLSDSFDKGVEWIKNFGLAIYNPSTRELFGFKLPTMPSLEDIKIWLSDMGNLVWNGEERKLFGFALPEIPSLEDITIWLSDMARSVYDPETRQLFGFTLPEIPSLEDITLWLADLGKSIWDGETRQLFGYQLPEIPSLSDIATWVSDLGKSIYDPETNAIFGFTLPELPSIDGMLDKIFDIAKSIYDPETGAIFGFDLMGGVNSVISKIADFGRMMKAISLAGFEAVKAGMPGGESPGEAFARKFAEVMETGNETTTAPEIVVPKADTQMEMISPDDEMNQSIQVINQINNNQQSNNQKTEVMAGNMDITIDPYTDRQLTSFGSVYP